MISKEELEKAKGYLAGCLLFLKGDEELIGHLHTALSALDLLLKASEVLPKKYIHKSDIGLCWDAVDFSGEGRNEMIDVITAFLVKKMEGLSDFIRKVDEEKDNNNFLCASAEELAEAIQEYILRKEE